MQTWRSQDEDGELGMGIWFFAMTIVTYCCWVGSSSVDGEGKGVLRCESIGDRQGSPGLGRALEEPLHGSTVV